MWDEVIVVTPEMALKHARCDADEFPDMELKLRSAHDLVLTHVHNGRSADEDFTDEMLAWTETTVPKSIQAAVLCQFLELVRFRGDDDPGKTNPHALSPYVVRLLLHYHTPAIA